MSYVYMYSEIPLVRSPLVQIKSGLNRWVVLIAKLRTDISVIPVKFGQNRMSGFRGEVVKKC